MNAVADLTRGFVAAIEDLVTERINARLRDVLAIGLVKAPERERAAVRAPVAARAARRKGPVQLCPVPRCVNRAAPSLGMVCMKHRAVPKATIRKYREARRARKAK